MEVFELYGEKIEFTEKQYHGIIVGRSYRNVLNVVSDNFLLFYNDKNQNEEGYWEDLNEKVLSIIVAIYKGMLDSMEKKGISTEDISALNCMEIFQYWIPVFERVDYEYNLIFMDAEQAEYYRRIRKEMRGRFVGGGFGLKGALKGMATAGALNMATGAAHSVFNFAGRIKDRVKQLNKLEKLFGNSFKKEILGVFEDTIQLAYSIEVQMIKEHGSPCKEFQLFYMDKEMSDKLFNPQSLQKHPFNKNLYEKALESLGDEKGELEKIAKFTGIDVLKIKEQYINESFANVEFDESTAQEVFRSIKKMKAKLGYSKRLEIEKTLGIKKKELEGEEKCMYDIELSGSLEGVVRPKVVKGSTKFKYKNMEILQEAKQKREEFVSIYNSMNTLYVSDMVESLEKLKEICSQYRMGRSVIYEINRYIHTKLVLKELCLNKGEVKFDSLNEYRCGSIDEYMRILEKRREIKEKCDYIGDYNIVEKYIQIRQIIGAEKWGQTFLYEIYRKINWERVIKYDKISCSEIYNSIMIAEDELVYDIPKVLLYEKDDKLYFSEDAKIHYETKVQAIAVLKFNKFVRLVRVLLIDRYGSYLRKIEAVRAIINNKPECLKLEELESEMFRLIDKLWELKKKEDAKENAEIKEKITLETLSLHDMSSALDCIESYIKYKKENENYELTMKYLASLKDEMGRTVLLVALSNGHPNIVKKLISYGADVNILWNPGENKLISLFDLAVYQIISDVKAEESMEKEAYYDKDESEKQVCDILYNKSVKRSYDIVLQEEYKPSSAYSSLGDYVKHVYGGCVKGYSDTRIEIGENLAVGKSKYFAKAKENFNIPEDEEVFFIYDASMFRNCKIGFAVCRTGIYSKYSKIGGTESWSWKRLSENYATSVESFLSKFLFIENRKSLFIFLNYLRVAYKYGDMCIEKSSISAMAIDDKETKFCTHCGKQIPRTAKFCNFCGAKVIIVSK